MAKDERLLHRMNEGLHDMCYIWAKEMRAVVKDEGVLIFFILVPLLYPLLYSWAYNNEVTREVPVAVVDQSHSALSRQFIRSYDAAPDVAVKYHCNSLDEAQRLVGRQVVRGVLFLPSDFESSLGRMEQTHVGVYCDMSIMLFYKAIYQTATSVAAATNSHIQVSLSGHYTEREEEISSSPLAFDEVPLFNSTGGYGSFILPMVLMLIIQQTLLLGIGLSAGTAREQNRYRDLVPVSSHYNGIFRIVLGKSACYAMVYAVMASYLVFVIPRLFHFTAIGRPSAILGLLTPYVLACIFFGMFMSCVIRYRENVLMLVVFTTLPFLFLAGISWPESGMPGAWKAVAYLIPSTFGVRGFVRINTMGATLSDVGFEYRMLWIQVLVYFFLTCAVYRHQIIRAHRHAVERIERTLQKAIEARKK